MGGRRSRQQSGQAGRILRVDLTTGDLSTETLDGPARRRYAGGSLLGTRLLMTGTRPGFDPFDPEALLVFASSAVAGRPAVFFLKYAATTEIYTLSLHDALPI